MNIFSKHNHNLQIVWDSTSLRSLQSCPRRYQYEILEGWRRPGAIDLEFGGMFQEGVEVFQKARLAGKTKGEAQLEAVDRVLEISGERVLDMELREQWYPWGGEYLDRWRCSGTEKYKNRKGNRAKCPWSHAGKWFLGPAPSICGECGSSTEQSTDYVPYHRTKNRYTLLRLIVWFCEEQDEIKGLQPYKFPDGTPAVELGSPVPLGMKSSHGEDYLLTANLDEIDDFGSERFLLDNKTTAKSLGKRYFSQFSPDVQFDTYDMVGAILFPHLDLKGIIVRGAQTMVNGARFGVHAIYKTPEQRAEHWRDTQWWIKQAERHANEKHWPMNKSKCSLCPFNGVCSKPPADRQRALEETFEKRPRWNPLTRGAEDDDDSRSNEAG